MAWVKICQHVLAAVWAAVLAVVPVTAETVDLELVLAVDASGSVDEGEYALQLAGIAAGFRDAAVREAIRSGPAKRIAVNLLTWAEPREPKTETGWFVLDGDASAERFASLVERLPRTQNGATGLGEGIAAAVRSLAANGHEGRRRVVDVSGDGEETPARDYVLRLPEARMMADAHGVIVNGLAIQNEASALHGYYRDKMRTGPGSFVIAVRDYQDFAEAMRRKLLREIEDRPSVSERHRAVPWQRGRRFPEQPVEVKNDGRGQALPACRSRTSLI